MRTFAVSDVPLAAKPLATRPHDEALRFALLDQRVEALCPGTRPLSSSPLLHPLGLAVHEAFFEHYPLCLSPDAVWFCLVQGFAHHVALNAEALRPRFVRHPGKQTLTLFRPDFALGQPNPWPEAIAAFSDQIAERVGRLRDLVVADFTTTGPLERTAFEVALMDAMQSYFDYRVVTGCGIPSITLLGTPEDWRALRRRAEHFAEFGLEAWVAALLPALDRVVRTAEGGDEREFWRSLFRYKSMSGGGNLTGWIHVLFPYVRDEPGFDGPERLVPNPHALRWEESAAYAAERDARGAVGSTRDPLPRLAIEQLPSGVASAPVAFTDLRDGSEHALRFVAGLFGVSQDPATQALAPEFGWAVVYDEPPQGE